METTAAIDGEPAQESRYGNWVRSRRLVILAAAVLAVLALALAPFPIGLPYRAALLGLGLVGLVSLFFPLYAYWMFSQRGGRFQGKVYDVVVRGLGGSVTGTALDVGAGNGMLAVTLARRHPQAHVVGVDSWSKDWNYAQDVCTRNAHAAQVAERVRFQRGDAAALEFPDGMFDAVVSNLTFHEVRSVDDKCSVVLEALRVLAPGGSFCFIDHFYDRKHYGPPGHLERYLEPLQLVEVELQPLRRELAIPGLLGHRRILGQVGVLRGRK